MKKLSNTLIVFLITYVIVFAQDPKAIETLKKVNLSLQKSKTTEYEYLYKGWGKLSGEFEGKVKISKEKGLNLLVELNTLKENSRYKEEIIYTNGNNIKLLDKTEKTYKYGSAAKGSGYLMSYAWYAVFRESLMPQGFSYVFQNKSLKYEREEKFEGVDCHVISFINQWGDTQYWYFDKEDYQIYGLKQENKQAYVAGGFDFSMKNLEVNTALTESDFKMIVPSNYVQVNEDERTLGIGTNAPEWILKNGAGKKISSKSLKGKVVVLDFWASWCNPCWKIMPTIDKIKADYQSKKVSVLGVNVWENPKLDVVSYLKKKNLNHYKVLFDQDAVVAKSFKIAALPLVVVIDQEGKIAYKHSGVDPDMDKNIRKIIDRLIQ